MTSDPRTAAAAAPDGASTDTSTAPRRGRAPRPPRAPRAPRPAPEGTMAVLNTAAIMLALVCLWTCAQVLLLSGISHNRDQALLFQQYRTQLADLTAPIGPVVPVGEPVALMSIPAIGLDEVIIEGTASGDLQSGPGHRRDTVLPGQQGISVVYGRGTAYGAPFADITDLKAGDDINLTTSQGERRLRVLGVRRSGDPLPVPPAAGVTRLTLVTAQGDGTLSAFTPDTTVFVDAEAPDGARAPAGRPSAVPDSEKSLARDDRAVPLLALDLALLLALALGVVAARQRWSASLVWVLASPLAVALAWTTTDTLTRLLPNLV